MKCRKGHEIKDGTVWPVHGVLCITRCCKRVTAPKVVLDWAVIERFTKTTYTFTISPRKGAFTDPSVVDVLTLP
jgi:hypothetical protein